jgi:hypothetical protein
MVSSGYHYSAPTIAIQLENKQAALSEPTKELVEVKPLASSAKISKRSISCKKGLKIKKVTAVKPICPVGYKKVV